MEIDEKPQRPQRLYLEDLREGDVFTSTQFALDVDQIKAFATQFDPQPFHMDEEAAKDSFFGGLAASGWHTAAITMRLLATGGIPLAGGIIGAGGQIKWPRPTRADDVLQVTSTVVEIKPSRSKPDRGIVTVRCETLNQRQELLQEFEAKLMVMRRATSKDDV